MAEQEKEREPGRFEVIVLAEPLRDFPLAIPGGCNSSNSGCSCNDDEFAESAGDEAPGPAEGAP